MTARRDRRGQWWVLNADAGMTRAEVMVFDEDFSRPRRVDVGDRADPLSLLVRQEDVLITDTRGSAILRVSLDGERLGRFGDARFQAWIETQRARQRRLEWLRIGSITGLLALLAAGLLALGVWRKRRLGEIVAADPAFEADA